VVEANIDRMRRLGVGKLDQRVAVITGGARGIGREIAVSFAREGARCVVGDLLDMGAVSEEIKSLGQDVLTVNAIAPGLVLTDFPQTGRSPEPFKAFVDEEIKKTPLDRAGTVQDVAKLALFLASDEASFLTGQIIALDGGRSS
jgi:NAD(P)-dependent dehydrogenase (short-subunit alcohol dehydrogenase family)